MDVRDHLRDRADLGRCACLLPECQELLLDQKTAQAIAESASFE